MVHELFLVPDAQHYKPYFGPMVLSSVSPYVPKSFCEVSCLCLLIPNLCFRVYCLVLNIKHFREPGEEQIRLNLNMNWFQNANAALRLCGRWTAIENKMTLGATLKQLTATNYHLHCVLYFKIKLRITYSLNTLSVFLTIDQNTIFCLVDKFPFILGVYMSYETGWKKKDTWQSSSYFISCFVQLVSFHVLDEEHFV